jgi:hypothetical protein
MLKNFMFFIACIKHNKEHYGGWNHPYYLYKKFLVPHMINSKHVIATNLSILRIFYFENLKRLESKLCKINFVG